VMPDEPSSPGHEDPPTVPVIHWLLHGAFPSDC
jgi:hypothetical protein